MVGKAGFDTTEEMTEEFMHAKLRIYRDRNGSPGWIHDRFSELRYNKLQSILRAADARRERLEAQAKNGSGEPDVSENITTILDNIVARDPERYLAWLSTMGYFYFTMNDHNPYGLSWEDWCAWKAPRSFEVCCKQASAVKRPSSGPGAINRAKYGPPSDRLTITLEEAKKGNKRALEFQDTADGMEVSLKEKAQYCMIGGVAMSREAAAYYYAIRGEDVWLYKPMEPVKEACEEDPSRLRESEIEASFRSWR